MYEEEKDKEQNRRPDNGSRRVKPGVIPEFELADLVPPRIIDDEAGNAAGEKEQQKQTDECDSQGESSGTGRRNLVNGHAPIMALRERFYGAKPISPYLFCYV